jgi:agmatinase
MKLFSSIPTKLFGVTCPLEEASVVIIPVPWEVTVSARSSTSLGPESILKASYELSSMDHRDISSIQKLGVALLPIAHDWKRVSDTLRHHTVRYIHAMEAGFGKYHLKKGMVKKVEDHAYQLKEEVKAKALAYLREDKLVGILGGDHSVPLGLIEALAKFHNNFGVLQIDAHPDLRKAYCGFKYSHASIMHNVLKLPHIIKVIQVGLRHCTAEELQVISAEEGRVFPFFDYDLKRKRFQGITWKQICTTIVNTLPERIYISFDIDGLDAKFCPSTGTPVPGGLELDEACYLFEKIVEAGKTIVGFDLCEVAPGERMGWDAQVGSRILCKMVVMMAISQGKMSP